MLQFMAVLKNSAFLNESYACNDCKDKSVRGRE